MNIMITKKGINNFNKLIADTIKAKPNVSDELFNTLDDFSFVLNEILEKDKIKVVWKNDIPTLEVI